MDETLLTVMEVAETLRVLNEASLFMLADADGESIFSIPGVSTVVVGRRRDQR